MTEQVENDGRMLIACSFHGNQEGVVKALIRAFALAAEESNTFGLSIVEAKDVMPKRRRL